MELTRDAMRMIASANFFNINRLSDEAIQENIDKIAEAVHDGIVHGATMFDFQMLPDDKKKFLKNIGKAELIYGDAHEFYGCGKDRTNDEIVSAIESAVKEGFITKKDFSREELEDAEKHLYDYDFNIVSHAAIDKFRKMFPEVGLYADPTDLAQEYIHTAMLAAAKDIEKDNKSLLQAFDGKIPNLVSYVFEEASPEFLYKNDDFLDLALSEIGEQPNSPLRNAMAEALDKCHDQSAKGSEGTAFEGIISNIKTMRHVLENSGPWTQDEK